MNPVYFCLVTILAASLGESSYSTHRTLTQSHKCGPMPFYTIMSMARSIDDFCSVYPGATIELVAQPTNSDFGFESYKQDEHKKALGVFRLAESQDPESIMGKRGSYGKRIGVFRVSEGGDKDQALLGKRGIYHKRMFSS